MPNCFIIMPISTPESLVPHYHGDKDHFQHVLDFLFFPAIEKAGLKAIAPIAKGADVIHAEIIRNLESADMVLCDMSSLNANVFFELGIRTALAKPVCVLKDDATPRVPFDMMVVNYHTYQSALHHWNMPKEIDAISEHLKQTRDRSQGKNMLWSYFGLSQRAELPISKDPTNERLALMMTQMEGLSKKMDFLEKSSLAPRPSKNRRFDFLIKEIHEKKRASVAKLLGEVVGMGKERFEEFVKNLPEVLLEDLSEQEAFDLALRFQKAGALITLRELDS